LRNLFLNFGRILRNRPDELPRISQTALYDLSKKVDSLDFFLSHSWKSSGYQKYISLLLHFLGPAAGCIAVLLAFAVYVFQKFHPLPYLCTRHDEWFGYDFHFSYWELGIAILSGYLTLFWGRVFLKKAGFLDGACIHQTDPELRSLGVRCLPGFLMASKNLIVMWDGFFLTRGWCCFEIATFRAKNPKGAIKLISIGLQTMMFHCHIYYLFCYVSFLLVWPWVPGVMGFFGAGLLAMFPVYTYCAYGGEDYFRTRALLEKQLAEFEFKNAEMQEESDKIEVLSQIDHMFAGGVAEFDRFMETEIREAVVAQFVQQLSPVPFSNAFVCTFPAVPFFLSGGSSQWGDHIDLEYSVSYLFFTIGFGLAVFPMVTVYILWLGGKYAAKDSLREDSTGIHRRHVIIGLLGSVINAVFCAVGYQFVCGMAALSIQYPGASRWHGLFLSAVLNGIVVVVAIIFFYPFRGSRASRPEPWAQPSPPAS